MSRENGPGSPGYSRACHTSVRSAAKTTANESFKRIYTDATSVDNKMPELQLSTVDLDAVAVHETCS